MAKGVLWLGGLLLRRLGGGRVVGRHGHSATGLIAAGSFAAPARLLRLIVAFPALLRPLQAAVKRIVYLIEPSPRLRVVGRVECAGGWCAQ
jgi:hypothetical protein